MLIVCIILTALAVWVYKIAHDRWSEGIEILSGTGAVVLGIIDIVMICFIFWLMTNGIIAEDKIKMYQEENNQIQESIDTIVAKYMDYEKGTFKNVKSESPITYVSLYPQLQADELVKKQIDLYVANNNKIKKLKEQEIEMKIGKWLLYFGG